MANDALPPTDSTPSGDDAAICAEHAPPWRLCVLISEALCPGGDWWAVARAIIPRTETPPAVGCIQLREKAIPDRELLDRAKRLVEAARPRGISVVINDRPDIALLSDADGVHLGQDDLPCAQARRLVGPGVVIGVSTSRLEEAKQAKRDGADYCGVGPMFATDTKHKDTIVGVGYLRQYLAWGGLGHLAIGGITPQNIDQLVRAGVEGVAVSSAICAAPDPAGAAETIAALLANQTAPNAKQHASGVPSPPETRYPAGR